MTDPILVTRKLAVLREHLARLRRRLPESAESLKKNVDLLDAIALSVLVVVQEAVDIAFHLASDEGWGMPSTYRAGFELLAEHGVIDADLASRLGGAARLRNRIAHGYASVDVDTLFSGLPAGIVAFDAFAVEIARYLLTPRSTD
jgi:uncharacterized protein YutE (UPF0331/DUF86 family)